MSFYREIPPLQVICLRSIQNCDAEATFSSSLADDDDDDDLPHSRLKTSTVKDDDGDDELRRQNQKIRRRHNKNNKNNIHDNDNENDKINKSITKQKKETSACRLLFALATRPTIVTASDNRRHDLSVKSNTVRNIPLHRLVYGGSNSKTRRNANDVDISAPWISHLEKTVVESSSSGVVVSGNDGDGSNETTTTKNRDSSSSSKRSGHGRRLVIEGGNAAVDCLQRYVDSLVDLGRMDDGRLGKNFFAAWKRSVMAGWSYDDDDDDGRQSKKRRTTIVSDDDDDDDDTDTNRRNGNVPLGSLSLHNCASASHRTFGAMTAAGIGDCLGALDLTGVNSLTDRSLEEDIVGNCPRMRRLSLKNCRKITGRGLASLKKLRHLEAIDVGGSFNITPTDVISLISTHPSTKRGTFTEIHASGLDWTDSLLSSLVHPLRGHLTAISVGFSPRLTNDGIVDALTAVGSTLKRLALPFLHSSSSSSSLDNEFLATLGRRCPALTVLDVRGATGITSITSFLDARAASFYNDDDEDADELPLFFLARYSGITEQHLEETRMIYPFGFECVIDGGGFGGGIRR